MYDPARYSAAIETLTKLFSDVNQTYVKKVSKQIAEIGELTPTSINRLVQMQKMGMNTLEIKRELADALNIGIQELTPLFQAAIDDVYSDPRFRDFVNGNDIPVTASARISQLAASISRQTSDTMMNFSNTTAINQSYSEAIDRAVTAVSSGVDDYKSATRSILREIGGSGVKVEYESGYHRRIDTAVRQNVTNAVKQVYQQSTAIIGEELGYDAMEISAHLRSAPDHEPIQGQIVLNDEFQRMQNGLPFTDADGHHYQGFRRPIGEWNCLHVPVPFNTKTSVRVYNDEQLAEYAKRNKEGCEIGGKHYTTYEASQYMRQIETDIRRQKDIAVAAKEAGDDELRKECQRKINALSAQYKVVSDTSGVREDRGRMVVRGFKSVKIQENTLKNAAGHDIIPVKHTTLQGEPNSITQITGKNGGINRNYYGTDGWQTKQISNNDHGHKAERGFGKHGEHVHDYFFDSDGVLHRSEKPRELTDDEREENQDFL